MRPTRSASAFRRRPPASVTTHDTSVAGVARALDQALAALATAAQESGVATVAPQTARAIESARATLAARERDIRVHERALDVFDRAACKRGAIVLGAAALLGLVALVLLLVRG